MELKIKFILVIFILFTKNSSAQLRCQIGQKCTSLNTSKGFAKLPVECKMAIELKKQGKLEKLREITCGFEGKQGIVCCPVSKAEEACDAFGERIKAPISIVDHIISGEEADLSEFPHFGAIAFKDIEEAVTFDCGSVLISQNFVLTAAHCANLRDKVPQFVRLGRTSLNDTDPDDTFLAEDIPVKRIILHPGYKPNLKDHDIALIELKQEVDLKYNIFPACLDPPPTVSEDLKFIVSGFGKQSVDNDERPSWMKKAEVLETFTETCQQKFEESYKEQLKSSIKLASGITNNVICAGGTSDRKDTCQGDSGSGMMKKINRKFYAYGITSFGVACGSPHLPSFYTRVSEYLSWIENEVWP